MKQSDAKGVRETDFFHGMETRWLFLLFNDDEKDTVQDESACNDHGHQGDPSADEAFGKKLLQGVVKQERKYRAGKRCDDHLHPKRKGFLSQDKNGSFPFDGEQLFSKVKKDCQNGAKLNDHEEDLLEGIAFLQAKPFIYQKQMPRAADREPLGDPLQNA